MMSPLRILTPGDTLVSKYCAAGTNTKYQRYVGATHVETEMLGLPDSINFTVRHFAGIVPPACSIAEISE